MVLGSFQCRGVLLLLHIVGQGPAVIAAGAGWCYDHVTVFRRTWTDAEELLKEKSFFILSFVFLSELVIRQVQTNIY